MATRGRHTREDSQKEFTGRVRRWTRTWVLSKEPKTKELKFRRWLQTDERSPELAGPRHSYISPLKDPDAQPYPKHRILLPQPAGAAGGALPASAAIGAPGGGLKRGKSQAAKAQDGHHGGAPTSSAAVPTSSQQAGAPAPTFKLKFKLGGPKAAEPAGSGAPAAPPAGAAPAGPAASASVAGPATATIAQPAAQAAAAAVGAAMPLSAVVGLAAAAVPPADPGAAAAGAAGALEAPAIQQPVTQQPPPAQGAVPMQPDGQPPF